MLSKVMLQELPLLLDLLGISEPPLPYEFVDDSTGGLVPTSSGWVVRIPQTIAHDNTKATAFYLHCLAHYILKHHTRKVRMLIQDVWDCAADYVANALLFATLHTHYKFLRANAPIIAKAITTLYPYRAEWEKLSVEIIYHRLLTTTKDVFNRYIDSHNKFVEEGGTYAEQIPVDRRARGQYGGVERCMQRYKAKIATAQVPTLLINELQNAQQYSYLETLDLLQLSYNRIDTYWIFSPRVSALHILDVSGSMHEHVSATAAACWCTVAAIYDIWGGHAEQLVLWADVEKQNSWFGYEPDNALLRKLAEGTGLGGTKLFSACLKEIEKFGEKGALLIVYSDLHLAPDDAQLAYTWMQQNGKRFYKRIAILPHTQAIPPTKQLFDVIVPLSEFFSRRTAK